MLQRYESISDIKLNSLENQVKKIIPKQYTTSPIV
jgi:hypothetical protein